MVWSGWVEEAHDIENEPVEIDDYEDHNTPEQMAFEDWCEWFERDLMNMWMSLRTYGQDAGTSSYILDSAQFNDFCWFAYSFSHGYPSLFPS